MSDDVLRWTKRLPTKPGRYLRNNPDCSLVLFADLSRAPDGTMRNYRVDSVSVEQMKGFWWFGPISDPPWEQEAESAKEALAHGRRQ